MTSQARSTWKEFTKILLIPAISGLVTAAFAVGQFKTEFKTLERTVEVNKQDASKDLTNAISIRRAEVEARIVPVESAYKAQGEALRELVSLARENAKGNEQVLVRIAKIEGKLDAYGEKLTEHIKESK